MAFLKKARGTGSPLSPAPVFLLILLLSSCGIRPLLVVSDPYVEILEERKWAPQRAGFKIRALLSGYRVLSERWNTETSLAAILENHDNFSGAVVLTPAVAHMTPSLSKPPERLIVAGGPAPKSSSLRWECVAPGRLEAFAELGKKAADFASGQEKNRVLLLTEGSSSAAAAEVEHFREAFRRHAGDRAVLEVLQTGPGGSNPLPSGFNERIQAASLLVLLAGPANLEALKAAGERGIPVFSESLGSVDMWPDNVLVSVENAPYSMKKAVLAQLKGPVSPEVREYPAEIVVRKSRNGKKWFDAILRQTYNSARR